jgi:hypothetical protein
MKKPVYAANLAIRFYKRDGWKKNTLKEYLKSGNIYDTEYSRQTDPPSRAYYLFDVGSEVNIEDLYKNEISEIKKDFEDSPGESDVELLKRMLR